MLQNRNWVYFFWLSRASNTASSFEKAAGFPQPLLPQAAKTVHQNLPTFDDLYGWPFFFFHHKIELTFCHIWGCLTNWLINLKTIPQQNKRTCWLDFAQSSLLIWVWCEDVNRFNLSFYFSSVMEKSFPLIGGKVCCLSVLWCIV